MATVAISSDFLTAFAALPRHVQGKVTDFVNKFRNDPTSPGINYEKINDATDKKMCSVRIDDTYRGIVVRQQETGVYLLLWVDHHDEAYDWANGLPLASLELLVPIPLIFSLYTLPLSVNISILSWLSQTNIYAIESSILTLPAFLP